MFHKIIKPFMIDFWENSPVKFIEMFVIGHYKFCITNNSTINKSFH